MVFHPGRQAVSFQGIEVVMFDKWCDSVEAQIDKFIDVVENVLFYAAIAGAILLAIVQIILFLISG